MISMMTQIGAVYIISKQFTAVCALIISVISVISTSPANYGEGVGKGNLVLRPVHYFSLAFCLSYQSFK